MVGTRVSGLEILIGSAIGLVTWPIGAAAPQIGIDASWIVGLHLAARQGLHFGQDIAFTFGPLGFLGWSEPYVAWTSAAALAFVAAIHLAACLTFLHLARQSVGLPMATALVLIVAGTWRSRQRLAARTGIRGHSVVWSGIDRQLFMTWPHGSPWRAAVLDPAIGSTRP